MRWFTIRIRKVDRYEYVWSDWGGWGPGVFSSWRDAFRAALRGI